MLNHTAPEPAGQAILTNTILVMLADDRITPRELGILEKIGRQVGVKKKQLEQLVEHPERLRLIVPTEDKDRTRQLIAMIAMMRADGEIDARERDLCTRFALAIGMPATKVSKVLAAAERGMRKGLNCEQIHEDISLTIDV